MTGKGAAPTSLATVLSALEAAGVEVSELAPGLRWELTDIGNAERLVHHHGDRIRYCGPWGCWLVWKAGCWHRDSRLAITGLAKKTAQAILAERSEIVGPKLSGRIKKHAQSSQSAARLRAMIELARDDVSVVPEELDRDGMLLNCLNGVIDLRTGKLLPHDPGRLQTKQAPVEFNPEARAPTWLAFLAEIMDGDREVIAFLKRVAGYALTGEVSEQCMFLLWGVGANGKSTFTDALLSILGRGYGAMAAPTLLMVSRGGNERHPTEMADLFGKRSVVCQEASEGGRLAETIVKQVTGGDRIKARFMHRDFFEFEPTHKLFLATNHKPDIRGTDIGIWRRIRFIPFAVTIPPECQDRQLGRKLREEAPGILNWAVQGCLDWQRGGLAPPPQVLAATKDYRLSQDLLASFFEQQCILEPAGKASAEELYQSYRRWCEGVGLKPKSQHRFGAALADRGLTKFKHAESRRVWYKGVRLVDDEADS